jgi:AcrR family transcriptional regulator
MSTRLVGTIRSVTVAPTRADKARATRETIGETALELFLSQGFADTTIDQIADAAGVGRRTVFRHFATKESIVLDHMVLRRDETLTRLAGRPPDEPPLTSLHSVLRELCAEGYDRRLLRQIRAVLATEPGLFREELTAGSTSFATGAMGVLLARPANPHPPMELHALTLMAMGWLVTAAHTYLTEDRPSMVQCFDEIVALSVQAMSTTFG